ncbi:hypothetical protein [Pediococcus acidilactici]|uniref:hypothetical protein n=1 Tax=Pediococcus acidilactici TaxID=1254 RepID=UPI00399CFBC6
MFLSEILVQTLFTSNKKLMGEFANHTWVKYAAWFATIVLVTLNIYLILQTVGLLK